MSFLFSNSLYDNEIRQRVSEFLHQNEKILWLGKPGNGSTLTLLHVGSAVLLTVAGTTLYGGYWQLLPAPLLVSLPFMTGLANNPVLPAFIMTAAGLLLSAVAWKRRPSQWAYAITNSRLLVVFGNKLLREKTFRQLNYVRIHKRQGDCGDIYWEIRSGQHRSAHDGKGNPLNRGPDGYYVGFKGQTNAEQLCTEILHWQKQALEHELDTPEADAEDYLANVNPDAAIKPSHASTRGSQTIQNKKLGFSVDVPAGWVTRVSHRTKGVLPFLKISFLDKLYRDGAFIPYTENLTWNLLITQGTEDCWLEIYCSQGTLTMDWNTVLNDPWATRLNQKLISQMPDMMVGEFKGFSITRFMSPGVTIPNYGTTKTNTHIQTSWLSNGKLAFEFRAIVPEHSATLQQAVATILTSLRRLES